MIKARPLHRGATIGIVGPSGPLREGRHDYNAMMNAIDKLGFRAVVADNVRASYGYLAGTDAQRAEGVNRMFRDDRVDAVVCMRGGYGAYRMLDLVDFEAIRANPKLLLGYSDITALHSAIHQRVGLITMHGPMPATNWLNLDDFTRDSLMRALTSTEPLGALTNPPGVEPECWVPGCCEGQLVGGNLSLIAAGCGTPYELDVTGKILLLEDIGEYTYRLDSMLTQLRLNGMFDRCAGVVLGGFTDCNIEHSDYGLPLDQIIRDVIVPAGKPVLGNMMIGHIDTVLTVPLGAMCRLDASARTLEITESALAES